MLVFYETGYEDGFAHGRIHGLIEGRALGRQHGFEMWEELGFYEGFAMTLRAIQDKQGKEDDRASQHIRHLLESISHFPRVNPSAADASSEMDISKLLRQIRSRYKMLCTSLGVRPRLRSSSELASSSNDDSKNNDIEDAEMSDEEQGNANANAHTAEQQQRRPGSTLSPRVAPGSAIPVWKIDNAGLKKPVTNQDLDF
ncbi:hypothetical protein CVT25_002040 [Psilocybe cyanescens]|uniref:Essential protein Yae1 N-terminal domain-containing protein n=1 Tax=Psilocybe cyanescens TaxID=93625 RepID=A0A409VTG2_PSICY|nr:hypothetical protein CVT25_002040 [Psilocybe cyanescens]